MLVFSASLLRLLPQLVAEKTGARLSNQDVVPLVYREEWQAAAIDDWRRILLRARNLNVVRLFHDKPPWIRLVYARGNGAG